ncbi:hypothetical protein ABDK00_003350 [Niabella insulamsoli]|uniref:hypothetical protein n=1 Tax=Niabella insulamsoli TaxID=3144874 RepID=UPI0031FE1D54
MKHLLQPVFTFITFLFFFTICRAGDFEWVKTEKEISVYERWVKHNGNTVRELKVEFTVLSASAGKVIALLKDPAKGPKWNTNAKKFRIVPTANEAVWLNYVRYDIPWPMNDQDCSLKFYYNRSELTQPVCHIYFEEIKTEKFPLVKDVTRITGTKGKWV